MSYPVLSTDNMQSMVCFMSLSHIVRRIKRTKLQSSNNPELDSWADFLLNYSQMFVLCSFHWMPLKQVTTATWSLYNGFCRIVCRFFFFPGFVGIEDFSLFWRQKHQRVFTKHRGLWNVASVADANVLGHVSAGGTCDLSSMRERYQDGMM